MNPLLLSLVSLACILSHLSLIQFPRALRLAWLRGSVPGHQLSPQEASARMHPCPKPTRLWSLPGCLLNLRCARRPAPHPPLYPDHANRPTKIKHFLHKRPELRDAFICFVSGSLPGHGEIWVSRGDPGDSNFKRTLDPRSFLKHHCRGGGKWGRFFQWPWTTHGGPTQAPDGPQAHGVACQLCGSWADGASFKGGGKGGEGRAALGQGDGSV